MTTIQAKDVRRVTGLSYRQIQYWDSRIVDIARRTGENQKVSFRTFSAKDVLVYKAVANLKKLGISLQMARKKFLKPLQEIFNHSSFGPGSKIILWGDRLALLYNHEQIFVPVKPDEIVYTVILDYDISIAILNQTN